LAATGLADQTIGKLKLIDKSRKLRSSCDADNKVQRRFPISCFFSTKPVAVFKEKISQTLMRHHVNAITCPCCLASRKESRVMQGMHS